MATNDDWVARQEATEEDRRAYERERLILWTTEAVAELMASTGMSRADLARRLGTTRAQVTQLLSGARTLTLGNLADIAWALGRRAVIKWEPLRRGPFLSAPVQPVDSHLAQRLRSVAERPSPYDTERGDDTP
ncbi:helix-turn-helix domain-containing protein [Luteibacter yeojuensis]|uniref:helix-turn-helix domain-containing protein n=1 Tax=Luteibacter yeojuensis TaxID=345309 RepID=UPI000698AA9B|nr:helix-turn-helix transcriptional regulator [Luteibacter yeojuensis]